MLHFFLIILKLFKNAIPSSYLKSLMARAATCYSLFFSYNGLRKLITKVFEFGS